MMTPASHIACLALFALTACTSGAPGRGEFRVPLSANPSGVIAAEIAYNQLAQEKGLWTATRATMGRDAVMFVPERVLAADWLKGKVDPPKSVTWQPYQVWTSCDGSAGVTHGAIQLSKGKQGYFTTVWFRQPDGKFKWIVDHMDVLEKPLAAPEMIVAKTATCTGRVSVPISAPPEGVEMRVGTARDQTLNWTTMVNADLSRSVSIQTWNGTEFVEVLRDTVAKP
jgi:hypothetical protein